MPLTIPDDPRTVDAVQAHAVGEWVSLSVELRPTEDRAGTGVIEPTRLRRRFTYTDDDRFTGVIQMYGDEYGDVPLMDFTFRGHLRWGDPHPIADGAFDIDYVLDEGFDVTPHADATAELLNAARPEGIAPFEVGRTSDILGKAFPLFSIEEGEVAVDHDLIWFHHGLLFMGAKHVDGTPIDRPDRRPHQLQVPLVRAEEA